jgi:lipopolysaccharide cholinephosphotransferase
MKRKVYIAEIQEIETEILKLVVSLCNEYEISYHLSYGSLLGAIRHKGPIPWDADVDIAIPYPQLEKFITIMKEKLPNKFVLEEPGVTRKYNRLFPRIGLKNLNRNIVHVDVFYWIGLPEESTKQKIFISKSKCLDQIFRYKNIPIESISSSVIKRFCAVVLKLLLSPITNSFILRTFHDHCSKYSYASAEFVTQPCAFNLKKNILKKETIEELKVADYSGIQVLIPVNYEKYLKNYYGEFMKYPPEKERNKGLNFYIEVDDVLYRKEYIS